MIKQRLVKVNNSNSLFVDGKPGGVCSGSVQCVDKNSTCINNICQCNDGYINVDGECTAGIFQKCNLVNLIREFSIIYFENFKVG